MCFFTKYLGTTTQYLVNIEGNSCNDNAVRNINFHYPSTTFTNEKKSTNIYLATNPSLTSDPSSVAFSNMFNTSYDVTSTVLAAALSGYGIDFMTGTFLRTLNARDTSARSLAEGLYVSFAKPQFDLATNKIVIENVMINGNPDHGTVYFLLLLYKQFVTNATSG